MQVIENPGCVATEGPTFFLKRQEAQGLMDELYRVGFRPTENHYTDETFKANREHIADLRRVAFLLLEREVKPI